MTANIFGITFFESWRGVRGDLRIPNGSSLRFLYRVFVHLGNAREANVAERYIDYIYPPRVEVRRVA